MALIIRFSELGPDLHTRLRRLQALVDLAQCQASDIWRGASNLPTEEAANLLQLTGTSDLVTWEQGIPRVQTAAEGYVLVGLTQLIEEIPSAIGPFSATVTRLFGTATYQAELHNISQAAALLLQEYLKQKE